MAEKNRFRTKCIRVKLSDEEYLTICDKAYSSDLSISDAIRSLIVFGSIKTNKYDENSQKILDRFNNLFERSLSEINHIGNNINQIAYNTNVKYNTELSELEEARRDLIRAYNIFLESIEEMRDIVNANNTYS